MDDRYRGPFFREVVVNHAERDEVELTTLRLNGDLAAYVLCFRDRGAYRMWSCRVSPEWRRYGAGRLANDEALANALADENCVEFDWMRGDEGYKWSLANHVELATDLMAWSSPAVRTVADARRRLGVLLSSSAERHPAVDRIAPYARRLRNAGPIVRRRLLGPR
jgi:CelD/BcsL family acetyltransferase involved in cellulose biosynthesis